MQQSISLTSRRFRAVTMVVLSILSVLLAWQSPSKAHAASQETYPKYAAVLSGGATVPDLATNGDAAPTSFTAVAGQQIGVEGGLVNETNATQVAMAQFKLQCYRANYTEEDISGPSTQVSVPGDPATFGGIKVMQKVRGTITIPADCVPQSTSTYNAPYDVLLIFEVDQNGMSAASDTYVHLGQTLPGPGLPAVGTVAGAAATTLYRAVDSTEFDAIANNGSRYSLAPGQMGKYFFPTKAQAEALATKYESMGLGDYVVTTATVDDAVLATSADSIAPAGEGAAYYLWGEEALAAISEVTLAP